MKKKSDPSTSFEEAFSALDLFCSIRKAEGAAPATLENYKHIIGPFLRNNPDFLQCPREKIISYISEPENEWTRFTRI